MTGFEPEGLGQHQRRAEIGPQHIIDEAGIGELDRLGCLNAGAMHQPVQQPFRGTKLFQPGRDPRGVCQIEQSAGMSFALQPVQDFGQHSSAEEQQLTNLRRMVWLYFGLLIAEGALRETAYTISQTPDLLGTNGGVPTISHDALNRTDFEASVDLRPPAMERDFALIRWNREMRHVIEPAHRRKECC